MTREEAIKVLKNTLAYESDFVEAKQMAIEALTHDKRTETHGVCSDLISRQAAVDAVVYSEHRFTVADEKDGMGTVKWDMCGVITEEAVHAIEALPSAEPVQPQGDLISREAAAEEFALHDCTDGKVPYFTGERVQEILKSLPPADTDMSEYSDRLWKAAYERGKADGCTSEDDVDYCTNCPHISWDGDLISRNELLVSIDREDDSPWNTNEVVVLIENAPSVTPTERVTETMIVDGEEVEIDPVSYEIGYTHGQTAPTERTGEWIPVSEGLPKEKQEVYVTVYFTEGDTGRAYGYIDGFGKWHLYSTAEGTLNSGYEVTAWMPLPEPYREDGE